MIDMSLIMVVEAFTFLISIGIKKNRVNIKKHEFQFLCKINDFTMFTGNLIELTECIFIHTVKDK